MLADGRRADVDAGVRDGNIKGGFRLPGAPRISGTPCSRSLPPISRFMGIHCRRPWPRPADADAGDRRSTRRWRDSTGPAGARSASASSARRRRADGTSPASSKSSASSGTPYMTESIRSSQPSSSRSPTGSAERAGRQPRIGRRDRRGRGAPRSALAGPGAVAERRARPPRCAARALAPSSPVCSGRSRWDLPPSACSVSSRTGSASGRRRSASAWRSGAVLRRHPAGDGYHGAGGADRSGGRPRGVRRGIDAAALVPLWPERHRPCDLSGGRR